jgi:hypothetical protein
MNMNKVSNTASNRTAGIGQRIPIRQPGSYYSEKYIYDSTNFRRLDDDSLIWGSKISLNTLLVKPKPCEYPKDDPTSTTIEEKEKYDKYLTLLSDYNHLKDENEKLKLLAYKSHNDLKEESAYEISRASMEKDSLLILMELRENKKLNYTELQDRVTQPENLFLRLSDLFHIGFISFNEEKNGFSITSAGSDYLEKRRL